MRLRLTHYRALHTIERHLRHDDALDTLFALFTRLNNDEELPAHERLDGHWHLHRTTKHEPVEPGSADRTRPAGS